MFLGVLLLMTGIFSFWFGFAYADGPYCAYKERRKYYDPSVCFLYMGIFATIALAGVCIGLYLILGGKVIECGV